jgi:hypothetical protein
MIKSRRIRGTRYAVCIGEKINAYKILVGNAEGKRPVTKHRSRGG